MSEMKTIKFPGDAEPRIIIDANAVHFTTQTLTEEQKTQARDNIGAATTTEVASFIDEKLSNITNQVGSAILRTPQDLSQEEQAQARENIGAVTTAEVASLIDERISSITNAEEVAY